MTRTPRVHVMVPVNDNAALSPEMARLKKALFSVVGALDHQAEAVSRLRAECRELAAAVKSCDRGLSRVRSNLSRSLPAPTDSAESAHSTDSTEDTAHRRS